MSNYESKKRKPYNPCDANADFSRENLNHLIATMHDWSISRDWTPEQTAAWRLRWFGVTPQDDARRRDEYNPGERDYSPREREPFNDWPNGQGTYD